MEIVKNLRKFNQANKIIKISIILFSLILINGCSKPESEITSKSNSNDNNQSELSLKQQAIGNKTVSDNSQSAIREKLSSSKLIFVCGIHVFSINESKLDFYRLVEGPVENPKLEIRNPSFSRIPKLIREGKDLGYEWEIIYDLLGKNIKIQEGLDVNSKIFYSKPSNDQNINSIECIDITKSINKDLNANISNLSEKTVQGNLTILENVAILNNKQISPKIEGSFSLSIEKNLIFKNGNVILLMNNSGGTACPVQFRILVITPESIKQTPEFGNCSDLAIMKIVEEKIVVTFPKFNSAPASTIIFDGNVLTKSNI